MSLSAFFLLQGLFAEDVWLSEDIGFPVTPGNAEYDQSLEIFTINGAGTGIEGTNDEFHFVSQEKTGDWEIFSHLLDWEGLDENATTGLMVRANN